MKKFIVLIGLVSIIFSQSAFAQRGRSFSKMTIGGEIGLGIPTGDFSDGANTGFGLNGVFSYFIQPDLAITGSLGYWSFGAKGSNEVAKATFSTIPLNAGIQYRFPASGFYPFIGAETFLFFNSVSVEYLGYKSSDSETNFGFVPLVGGAFKIAPNLELRVSLKYTIIFTSGSNTTYLNLLGGIHFFI
ncbi:hypothetical protein D9V87_00745 [Bacteroidetes/Chlorobi group bacterium MS-B_bin-24]|nr:MAG: hypothetical protein D9V87_00745 [Bacteroidetes/Chlorobi group bacterium MS-B_bin-24]